MTDQSPESLDREEVSKVVDGIIKFIESDRYDGYLETNNVRSTLLHKLVWRVTEELDLDVTWAWYKRGPYILNGGNVIQGKAQSLREGSTAFEESELTHAVFQTISETPDIQGYFRGISDVLKKVYHRSPDPYHDLYTANDKFAERMRDLLDADTHEEFQIEVHSLEVSWISDRISDLHMGIYRDEFEEFKDEFIEFTSVLEEFLIALYFRIEEGELTPDEVEASKRIISRYYDQKNNFDIDCWEVPASLIAERTVTGRDAERQKVYYRNKHLGGADKIERLTKDIEEEMEDYGLSPNEEMYDEMLDQITLFGNTESKIKDYWETASGARNLTGKGR